MTQQQRNALVAMILKLRPRIAQQREQANRPNEQETKRVFITPLLGALGWDIEDLHEVRNEYKSRPHDNPVDYALFKMGTPCLFVEAKALKSSLGDRKWISQTIGYAATVGVEWCVLTDGDEYRLYNAHAPVDADAKLFRTIRISDQSAHDFTIETLDLLTKSKMGENRLTALWKAHFIDRRVKASLEALMNEQDAGLARLVHKQTSGLTHGDIKGSLKRATLHVEFATLASPAPPEIKPSPEPQPKRGRTKKKPSSVPGTLKDLIDAGLIRPPLELRATWKKKPFSATVQEDGAVSFGGTTYNSLSIAGGMARKVANGTPPDNRPEWPTNGWTFWKFQDPETGKLQLVDVLRQRHDAKKG